MRIETLIGRLLIKSKEYGTRKTRKVLGDKLFYKSGVSYWFNMMNIRQLTAKELKQLIKKLES